MSLIFGHKDLIHKKYDSLHELMKAKNLNLDRAVVAVPYITASSTELLDKSKENAQFYLDLAYSNYISESKCGFMNCIHNSDLAIKRRYDELISDILDIDHLFNKNQVLKNVKKFEFLSGDLNIFIPNLIKEYVVNPRNNLEHQFQSSSKEDSMKAYEISRLFIDYTGKYLEGGLIKDIEAGYGDNDFGISEGFDIRFGENTSKKTKKRFLFTYKNEDGDTGDYFILDSNHPEYLNLIKNFASPKTLSPDVVKAILKRI